MQNHDCRMAIDRCLLFWLPPGSERSPGSLTRNILPWVLVFALERTWWGQDLSKNQRVIFLICHGWTYSNIGLSTSSSRTSSYLDQSTLKDFFLSHEILIQGRMLKKLIPLSLRNFPLLSEPPHKNRPDPGISSRNHISSPSYISISFGEYFSCKKSLCRFVFIGQLALSARRFVCRIWRAISVLSDVSFFTLAWEYSLSVLCLFKYCVNKNLTLKLPEINISSFPNTFKTNWGKDNP